MNCCSNVATFIFSSPRPSVNEWVKSHKSGLNIFWTFHCSKVNLVSFTLYWNFKMLLIKYTSKSSKNTDTDWHGRQYIFYNSEFNLGNSCTFFTFSSFPFLTDPYGVGFERRHLITVIRAPPEHHSARPPSSGSWCIFNKKYTLRNQKIRLMESQRKFIRFGEGGLPNSDKCSFCRS